MFNICVLSMYIYRYKYRVCAKSNDTNFFSDTIIRRCTHAPVQCVCVCGEGGAMEAEVSFNARGASVAYDIPCCCIVVLVDSWPYYWWKHKNGMLHSCIEQGYTIEFCLGLGKSAMETLDMIQKVFGNESRQCIRCIMSMYQDTPAS